MLCVRREFCRSYVKFSNMASCGMTLWKWKISLSLSLSSLFPYRYTSKLRPSNLFTCRRWAKLRRGNDPTRDTTSFASPTRRKSCIYLQTVIRRRTCKLPSTKMGSEKSQCYVMMRRNVMSLGRFVENPRKYVYIRTSLFRWDFRNELNEFT